MLPSYVSSAQARKSTTLKQLTSHAFSEKEPSKWTGMHSGAREDA